jgi:hypothetical protein
VGSSYLPDVYGMRLGGPCLCANREREVRLCNSLLRYENEEPTCCVLHYLGTVRTHLISSRYLP